MTMLIANPWMARDVAIAEYPRPGRCETWRPSTIWIMWAVDHRTQCVCQRPKTKCFAVLSREHAARHSRENSRNPGRNIPQRQPPNRKLIVFWRTVLTAFRLLPAGEEVSHATAFGVGAHARVSG